MDERTLLETLAVLCKDELIADVKEQKDGLLIRFANGKTYALKLVEVQK